MKQGRWVWISIGAACTFITVVLILITKWGVHVRPIGLMKPSFFSSGSDIGVTVLERLYPELELQNFVVWGSQPGASWYEEAAIGFASRAQEAGIGFKTILIDQDIPAPRLNEWAKTSGLNVVYISFNVPAENVSELAARFGKSERQLVYTAGIHATSQLFGNAMARLKQARHEPIYTIVAGPLSRAFGEEDQIEPRCVGLANDQQGTRDLGCFLLQQSRAIYRKKNIPRDRFTAIMNQDPYSKDIVLQIAPPDGQLR